LCCLLLRCGSLPRAPNTRVTSSNSQSPSNCLERVERRRQQGVRGAAAERSQRDPHLSRGASCDQQQQQIQRQRTTTNTTNMAANGDGAVMKDGAVVEREETVESSAAKTTTAAVVPDVAVVA
ncbi:unnamed protein product, partial [Ectocarpus sp. 13 AM-2016]